MDIRGLWDRYRMQTMLMKIIIVNALVFLALRLADIVALFSGSPDPQGTAVWLVEMPSWPSGLLGRPWTVVSYMWAQFDVLHFVFNMLWLYWFGIIFQSLSTQRRLLGLYVLGGLGGAALYFACYNLLPFFSGSHGLLIGSSAAVIAIVAATAIMAPDYRMGLLLIGSVSLKWVALVTIAIDLVSVTGGNAGGHIAHLGGALTGALFGLQMRRGRDITAPLNALLDRVTNLWKGRRSGRKMPRTRRYDGGGSAGGACAGRPGAQDQAALDAILDKIKKSGYTSLTAEERKRLFDISSRIK